MLVAFRNPPRPCENAIFGTRGSGQEARKEFAGGLDFVRRRPQAALIAWIVGPTPRMAINLFKL